MEPSTELSTEQETEPETESETEPGTGCWKMLHMCRKFLFHRENFGTCEAFSNTP